MICCGVANPRGRQSEGLFCRTQFEREVAGERIRDKIAASKKKGLWMGGVAPLGYRVEDRKLIVDKKKRSLAEVSSNAIWNWAR